MNKNILLMTAVVVLGGIIAYLRHREVKLKLPSWKKMVLIGILIFVIWYNWAGIRSGLNRLWTERMIENIDELDRKNQVKPLEDELNALIAIGKERPYAEEERKRAGELKVLIKEHYLESEKQKLYKPEPIIRIFDVPAGNGKNEVGNLLFTGLFPNKGDHIQFIVLEGGPAQYRNGITNARKDRVQFNDQITIQINNSGGEIQFIKWNKPTKVKVIMTSAN